MLVIIFLILIAGIPLIAYKYNDIKKAINEARSPVGLKIQATKYSPKPISDQKGPFNCPSVESFCKNGKDIFAGGSYIGFGAKVPEKSNIYAAFDGQITSSVTTLPQYGNEEITSVYLDNPQKGLRGIYYYKGALPTFQNIKAGQQLAVTNGNMSEYQVPLVFALIRNDPLTNPKSILKPSDFK